MTTTQNARHGRYEVKIMVNGIRAQELNTGARGRVSTWWMESITDAEFSIHVTEHPSATSADSKVDVSADGMIVGSAILKQGETCHFMGSWIDRHALRPFVFLDTNGIKPLKASGGSNTGGCIIVKISEVVVHSLSSFKSPPPPLAHFESHGYIGVRRNHRVGLSATTRFLDYGAQASKFEAEPFDPLSSGPIAIFEIFYRSKSYLKAKNFLAPSLPTGKSANSISLYCMPSSNISTRTSMIPLTAQEDPARHPRESMTLVPNTSKSARVQMAGQLKNAADDHTHEQYTPIKTSKRCFRCTQADTECIWFLGKSVCSRCARRKQRYYMKDAESNGVQLNEQPGKTTSLAKPSSSTHKISVTPRCAEGTDPERVSDSEATDDHSSDSSYNDREAAVSLPFMRQTRKMKGETYSSRHRDSDGGIEIVEVVQEKPKAQKKLESAMSGQSQLDKWLKPDQPHEKANTPLTKPETLQAHKLLASLRGWSDDLMRFVVDGDEKGPVVDTAREVIKELEGKYRSLQTLVLQSDRERAR